MKEVFCLMHSYTSISGEVEDKILAYFETSEEANNAVQIYGSLPGFSEHPDGFSVDKICVGRLFWEDGFETILDNKLA